MSLQTVRKDELRWTWCYLRDYCSSAQGNIRWVKLSGSSSMVM